MEEREYIDLLELQTRIKEGIQDAFPGRYWVKAEISSWSPRANGHCYLTLTQSRAGKPVAESRAMIWKWHYTQIVRYFEEATGQKLQAGITVLVKVQVSFSELYGISLYIEDIDAAFTLHLYEATMQGEQAPSSIADALLEAQEKDYDAILILRGGGSETDLLCFDDFNLAIAIATCPVPVVTAIGHDKDVHIADMVAHESVKTPTALADLFLDALAAAEDAARDLVRRIAQAAMRLAGAQELRLESLDSAIHRAIRGRVAALEVQLQRSIGRITKGLTQKYSDVARLRDTAVHRIQFAAQARIGSEVSRVALKEAVITGSDPRKILGLGYVLVTGKDNKILKTVDRVAVGDRIGVRFNDGSLTAKVDEIYSDKIDNTKTNIA